MSLKNDLSMNLLKIIIIFISIICITPSVNSTTAEELFISSNAVKKYNLSVCAIFKNEAHNLKEWIVYHHNLGVDHFYLYNCGSKDDFYFVLNPYIDEGIVTLINWPNFFKSNDEDAQGWILGSQVPAYENAVNFLARDETKWLVLIDIDEYLVCQNGSMEDLLIDYDDFPSITLSSCIIDGTIKDLVPLKKIFSQAIGRSNSETQIPDESVAKMIFKPELCSGFIWPPYQCKLNTLHSGIKADPQELRIDRHLNKNRSTSPFKNKSLAKQDTGNILFSVGLINDGKEKEYQNEYWDLPMYFYIPEFLKNLKSKELQKFTF